LVTDFIEYCELEKNLSQGTVQIYDFYLSHFDQWLDQTQGRDTRVEDLTYDMVKDYRLFLTRQVSEVTRHGLKRSYQNYFLVAIRAFLKFLAKRGHEVLSSDQVELGKQGDRIVKFLDDKQLQQLLEAPDTTTIEGLRDR